MIVAEARLRDDLCRGLRGLAAAAVVLHTDLMRIGSVHPTGSREEQLQAYLRCIEDCLEGRTLLFPTFNYAFLKSGIYDVVGDPCQVGVLNEYVRRLNPAARTQTPVFNFCVLKNRGFSLETKANPLASDSTFGELVRQRGAVVFFGASFEANTLIHHVEEMVDVSYRYIKRFPGIIRSGDSRREIVLHYRVRPIDDQAVAYDWTRLREDLETQGILRSSALGRGRLSYVAADRLAEYWCDRLREDELSFLTPASRERVGVLFRQHGRPLRYEAVELVANRDGA